MNDLTSRDQKDCEDAGRRLMIGGVLTLANAHGATVLVERGMAILSSEGQEIGKVAAVRVTAGAGVETILLSRLPAKMEYLVVPAGRVVALRARQLTLDLPAGEIDCLEKWAGC